MRFRGAMACLLALLVLAGCSSKPDRKIAIGEAYVGPANLKLREDLSQRAKVSAVVHHGERLEILEVRRRFVLVRTAGGAEGWLDSRILLSPSQMTELRRAAQRHAQLPSQGKATPFDLLNVHTEPNRQAPTFYQLQEGEMVDVIGRRLVERAPYQPAPLVFAQSSPRRRPPPAKKPQDEDPPPPPRPEPPGPPVNWLELSRTPAEIQQARTLQPDKPAPDSERKIDNWYLLRLGNGNVGWALARMLRMTIPDEVAQYAQGHRITSFFPIGWVKKGDELKYHWLWTTSGNALAPYDFDSFRVFVWSTQRRRYETIYVERNLQGFYPVEVEPLKDTSASPAGPVAPLHFHLIFRNRDARLWRRTYQFHNQRVRFVGREPARIRIAPPGEPDSPPPQPEREPGRLSTLERVQRQVGEWKQGILRRR